ncbi:unnamed protein product [Sphenostylis stenocarpa]|uniref:Uncharacterized protein n=1 Tax=Sphenostylis stenocarpa TaxID=92480 RepID=A0AA86VCE3_9FABA|nr:unnamed protein product [Sphenostylis stenocarpa]
MEIISGKKSKSFIKNSYSILHTVWSLYGSNKLCDIVDPILEGNYPAEEACKLLKIGLLCAQASAELRPPMSVVVKMIKNNHEITQPTQPPFLNCSSAEFSKSILPEDSFQPRSYPQSSEESMTEGLIQHKWIWSLVETTTGAKHQSIQTASVTVRDQIWKHFQAGTAEQLFDPNLELQEDHNGDVKDEILRVVHIGLLYT